MRKQQNLSQDARRKQETEAAAARRQHRNDQESDPASDSRGIPGTEPPPPLREPLQGKIDRERAATPAADRRLSHDEAADAARLANTELEEHPL
ncbi:hypothetical protein [Nocardia aurantia]|uniref:Uncharacterized protein n=1 Tax=Nocardia aurantia TaxID=2585199 RepID=A0A7K0DWR2_9NOCA|nr:hypothetical protein [Nocardia aurantia]MQY30223.1 hypothetical protein [Nocardia aurantia]